MNKEIGGEMVLYIDTSDNTKVTIALSINGEEYKEERVLDTRKSQIVLPVIDALFNKHGLTLENLTAIDVHTGPGSFTGLRVGISIANTLGTLLHIPINKKEVGILADAQYA